MGLDMYLTKKTYIGNEYRKPEQRITVNVPANQDDAIFAIKQPIKSERITEISERVGYWRKANAIHKWFVDNCQDGEDDCRDAEVEESKLIELLTICKAIKTDNKKAAELLPPKAGFFFGGTEIDEGYFTDIDDTIKIIEDLFAEKGDAEYLSGDIYYQSSW